MINHRSPEITKPFESQVDPEKAEELRRTKTDIENNLARILKLVENKDRSKKGGNPRQTRKETELVRLIEDFHKQYQSLNALYDSVTGEYGKVVVPSRTKSGASLSPPSSDSEYFSSDEVDDNNQKAEEEHHNNVSDNAKQERECSTVANTAEVLETRASAKVKEIEEKLASQMEEVESFSQQKRTLQLELETQAHEVEELRAKNTGLHARVMELELLLKEEKCAVSGLQGKLSDSESQAKANISEFMAQTNKLAREVQSLRNQKDEMEEKMRSDKNEALSQRKGLTDQLNVMQQNLDTLFEHNKELEAQMEREREKISQYLIQIENLEENLAEKSSTEQMLLEEKEHFLTMIEELELELASRSDQKNVLEEQLRTTSYEINWLGDQKNALQDRNHELRRAMTMRGEEISTFLSEYETNENEASVQLVALTAEVNDLRLELDTLKEQKDNWELQNERNQKEYEESLAKIENLNAKLASHVAEQEKTIQQQAATIEKISAEYREAKIASNKFRLNRQNTERKIEELAEEFRKKAEDNIRLLHRRIHIAEQLNNENKDSYNMIKQRYEEEKKMLGEKIANFEGDAGASQVVATPSPVEVGSLIELELSALNGLDMAVGKLEEHKEYVLNRVSRMMDEVRVAKDWMKEKNGEMKQLKDNVDFLKELLSDKEEEEFLLREKVWKLEANVSKEGGEKLNLMNSVSQLEKKVGNLEKCLKEKDEDLIGLGEKKREAIRQLCFLVDFHRDRCDYLKDLVTKMKVSETTWD